MITYNDGMLRPENRKALRTNHSSTGSKNGRGVNFLFFKFFFNLNMFSVKQEKMGLVFMRLVMYEYSVLIDES